MSDREAPRVYYLIEEVSQCTGDEKFNTLEEAIKRFKDLLNYDRKLSTFYTLARIEEFYRNETDMYPDNNYFILAEISIEDYKNLENKEEYIKSITD